MRSAVPSGAPNHDLVLAAGVGHRVQFYDDDASLVATVTEFLAAGLTIAQPAVIVATGAHRAAFQERLRAEGFDLSDGGATRLIMLDARETLDALLVGGTPDPVRFRTLVGATIGRCFQTTERPVVRLYGEMVDLLWRDGNMEGALRLEELWNEIGRDYTFSLLCSYAMANFYRSMDVQRFHQICRLHTEVVPCEPPVRHSDAGRRMEWSLAAHRTLARDSAHEQRRREREGELHDLLGEHDRLLEAEPALERFALAPLVNETVSKLEPLIAAIRLTCDVAVALPSSVVPITAYADREQTHRIVVTLLMSAIEFTPPGGRIGIEISESATLPNTVRIRVTDPGMDLETRRLDLIFEPLVHARPPWPPRHDTVGLGLVISRDVARRMGGDLTVSSARGVGTTFTLTLPATPAHTPAGP